MSAHKDIDAVVNGPSRGSGEFKNLVQLNEDVKANAEDIQDLQETVGGHEEEIDHLKVRVSANTEDIQDLQESTEELQGLIANRAPSDEMPSHMGRGVIKPNGVLPTEAGWYIYEDKKTIEEGPQEVRNILIYFDGELFYLPYRHVKKEKVNQ